MEEIRKLMVSPHSEESDSSHQHKSFNGPRNDSQQQLYAIGISKVDFPKCDGKKMKEWLYKCDQFFALDATHEDAKVRLASIHLEGPSLQWHVNYMKAKYNVYPTWTDYVVDVTQRFGEVFEDPLAELIQVKQTGSVQEYIDAFELAYTQGLCMYCDEPFTPGHQFKHKRTQVIVMELDDDESILESNEETAVNCSVGVDTQSEEMQLSLHALTGLPSYQTMKICGSHNQKTLQILLDSGSTHNFLDLEVAKKLGCKLEPVPPMIVTAGGGNKLHAPFSDVTIPAEIKQLLHLYADLFENPQGLPPPRPGFDHKLPLKEGTTPFNIRPYRYASIQKDIVDGLVEEMLEKGWIQHSNSPFASPVVLVRKKGGKWRLCVDYRRLNQATIKDKFPIPLIEDLMDELGGSVIYSKLDLQSGYHQMRMAAGEEYKTTFKTHAGHFEYLVMPFGLTNAPASFQSLMNILFQQYLRKFVIIFFDDILIYSSSLEDHVLHLDKVFQILREHKLFLRKEKCCFATSRVEYLGHVITKEGVSTDPNKIQVVSSWPLPSSVKQLRGFLGLAGYYRRFVKDFGKIAKPLNDMLKKYAFHWSIEATQAFTELKHALTSTPVLALPNFNQPFILETNASGKGIGAVLMQNKHPIAYISKALGPKQQAMSVYERELLAIVYAIQKWSTYLAYRHFIIKTDQKSIKFMLEQRLNTPFQQVWMAKLMGYDFEIHYKEGVNNNVADALSRRTGAELLPLLLNNAQEDLLERIKESWSNDVVLHNSIQELQADAKSHPKFTWCRGELRRKGKLVIGADPTLKQIILNWLHDSPSGGHSGRDVTAARVKSLFFWKGVNKDIQHYVRNCDVCQRCKPDLSASPGLLQPLPIPKLVWDAISMDFIEGLPTSSKKQVIFVVVDRLSKYAHFMALAHPYTALDVAQQFLDNVFKLHGMPSTITSDRDPIFLSKVWNELFQLQGVALNKSTAYHPQSDGQTEVVNKCLETYLRCMCADKPSSWSQWLSLAEWWYNTNYHTSIHSTPFEVVYGQPPPIHLPYLPEEATAAVVDRSLSARDAAIQLLKFHLLRAQNKMTQQVNKHRSDKTFSIGDMVYLKLQPYRQSTIRKSQFHKLVPKFYGPFKILDSIGQVAYQLELPPNAAIHNVFHVSQLKLCFNPQIATTYPLPNDPLNTSSIKEPEAILERKMVKRGNSAATKVLVQWKGEPSTQAIWEFYYDLLKKFPNFHSHT
ncbi:hypothetical protein TSUD_147110 [Trifolium subterraneum]|uniref:Reverse transcriptase n=1 Tax=Trifolium subterraneum TaxID=3900 RepID=A0A2Z6NDL5_TRISU|nr:hypothetical protein TSUD_147110 [Trifolium subterraneum]